MIGRKRESYHHGNLREALVETALTVLSERGIEGFTLRECARRLGVSATSASHHFRDVNGLFAALAVRGFHKLRESLHEEVAATAARGCTAAECLQEICEEYLLFAHHNPDLYRITFGKLIKREDAEMKDASMAAFHAFAGQVARARGIAPECNEQQINQLATVAWGALHGCYLTINHALRLMRPRLWRDEFMQFGRCRDTPHCAERNWVARLRGP